MFRTVRKLALAAAVAAMPLAVQAADVAEGNWINLFDGESLFGWTQFGNVGWETGNGVLSASTGDGGWVATTSQFKNFELSAEVKMEGPGTMGLAVRAGLEGHAKPGDDHTAGDGGCPEHQPADGRRPQQRSSRG